MHFDGQTSAAALPVTIQEEQAILIASYIDSDDFGDIAVCADCNLITINPKNLSHSSGVPAVTSRIL